MASQKYIHFSMQKVALLNKLNKLIHKKIQKVSITTNFVHQINITTNFYIPEKLI